jgi:hypothetical protein
MEGAPGPLWAAGLLVALIILIFLARAAGLSPKSAGFLPAPGSGLLPLGQVGPTPVVDGGSWGMGSVQNPLAPPPISTPLPNGGSWGMGSVRNPLLTARTPRLAGRPLPGAL